MGMRTDVESTRLTKSIQYNMEKRAITFSDSMTIDKRNSNFAYLRKNVFPAKTEGLYPARDFIAKLTPSDNSFYVRYSDDDFLNLAGATYDGITIVQDSSTNTMYIYRTSSGALVGTYTNTKYMVAIRDNKMELHIIVQRDGTSGSYYSDGINKLLIINSVDGSSFVDDRGDITGGMSGNEDVEFAVFDGRSFFWGAINSNPEIYRSLPGDKSTTTAFTNVGMAVAGLEQYNNDWIVIFAEDNSSTDTYCFLWNKDSGTLLQKRIIIKNERFIAGGTVNGKLMLVTALGASGNHKEREAELKVSTYDGEKFIYTNSIKLGRIATRRTSLRNSYNVGPNELLFGLQSNNLDKDELFENWLVRVDDDGKIEVLWDDDTYVARRPRANYQGVSFVRALPYNSGYSNYDEVLYSNQDNSYEYDTYNNFSTTKYITNFLNESRNNHSLENISISFEKLHDNEECKIYYRTSDREDFVLLGTINQATLSNSDPYYDPALKASERANNLPIKQQVFDIVKMPDKSSLPEFHEIQFKFELMNGFSIIQAWYGYDYLVRNVIK